MIICIMNFILGRFFWGGGGGGRGKFIPVCLIISLNAFDVVLMFFFFNFYRALVVS